MRRLASCWAMGRSSVEATKASLMRAVRAVREARPASEEDAFPLVAGFRAWCVVLWVAGVAGGGVTPSDCAATGETTMSTASAAVRQRAEPEFELFEVGTFMFSLYACFDCEKHLGTSGVTKE